MGSCGVDSPQNRADWPSRILVGWLAVSFLLVIYSLWKEIHDAHAVEAKLTLECTADKEHVLILVRGKYFCVKGRILE